MENVEIYKIKNIVTKLIIIFMTVTVIFSIVANTNKCWAIADITEDLDFWKTENEVGSNDFDSKIGAIVGIVRIIGIFISVETLSVIGIKFMLGSVEQRAQYKQTLLPWLIGAILVFSITFVPTIIYNFINDNGVNKTEELQISIDKTNVTLKIGENEEVTLKATITPTTNKTVRWTSYNP